MLDLINKYLANEGCNTLTSEQYQGLLEIFAELGDNRTKAIQYLREKSELLISDFLHFSGHNYFAEFISTVECVYCLNNPVKRLGLKQSKDVVDFLLANWDLRYGTLPC